MMMMMKSTVDSPQSTVRRLVTRCELSTVNCRLLAITMALTAAACVPQTASTPKAGSKMPSSIIDPYLKIQTALANDSTEGIRQNAGDIAPAATALGAPAFKIDTAAAQLTSAGDLDDARAKFGALSVALDTYMTGLHLEPPDEVRVAFCPMENKPWLQKDGAIQNPYYGSKMISCGDFKK